MRAFLFLVMYTLFYNGIIHTLNNDNPECSALLVHGNKIIFCGHEKDINLPDSQVNKINLNGCTVLPSFIDSHTHIAMASKMFDQISIENFNTFDETLQKIKNNLHRFEKGNWIKGSGWNSNIWGGVVPDKTHLDSISQDHPIALFNQDLHTMWLNTFALKKSGFFSNIPSPLKNKIRIGNDGEPTGLIFEDACAIVEEIAKENISKNPEQNLIRYSEELLKVGITSVNAMENLDDLELFMKLHRNKLLKTRICFHPPAEEVETIAKAKIQSGYGNEWIRFGGLKYFVDGSIGSQTSEMFEDFHYLNHAGIEMMTQDELTRQIKYAASKGLSATVHAIGDKAVHKTINAMEESVKQVNAKVPLINRIEHCQIITESDRKRLPGLNIIASMQPLHIADDVKISDKYLGERAKNAYPIKSLLKLGVKVAFGSDTPVADYNPFKGMLAALTRWYHLSDSEPSWYPEQNITINEAIAAYTKDAAYATYEQDIKGTLAPGKLADFVILSDDLLKSENTEDSLKRIEVMATVIDGITVYKSEKFNI